MHDEYSRFTDGILPAKGGIHRTGISLVGERADEACDFPLVGFNETVTLFAGRKLFAPDELRNVARWSVDAVDDSRAINRVEFLIVNALKRIVVAKLISFCLVPTGVE